MKFPKKIKAVLLDVDGVLIDSLEMWYIMFCKFMLAMGKKPWSKIRFRSVAGEWFFYLLKGYNKEDYFFIANKGNYYAHGKDLKKAFSDLEFKIVADKLKKEGVKMIFKNYIRLEYHAKIFPDTKKTLVALRKKGFKLATVTNTQKILSTHTLRRMGLLKYFDVSIFREDVKRIKPKPDMLLLAVKKLRVKKNEVIFIGDMRSDRAAAKAAGIYFIGRGTTGNKRIEKLPEILSLI